MGVVLKFGAKLLKIENLKHLVHHELFELNVVKKIAIFDVELHSVGDGGDKRTRRGELLVELQPLQNEV